MFKNILNQLVQTSQGAAFTPQGSTTSSQLKGMMNNPAVSGALAGVGGGLLSGMLFNNTKARSIGGSAASHIGAAALGGIALTAFNKWQANKSHSSDFRQQNYMQQPPQSPQPKWGALDFDSMPETKQEEHSRAMLSAVIAAAKADGVFDQRERQLIREQTEKLNDPAAMAWVQQEINKPLDVGSIAGLATSPEMAAEIYLASLIVIDEQNELEKNYLNALAKALNLDPQLRYELERQ